jgi:hypothetical protein
MSLNKAECTGRRKSSFATTTIPPSGRPSHSARPARSTLQMHLLAQLTRSNILTMIIDGGDFPLLPLPCPNLNSQPALVRGSRAQSTGGRGYLETECLAAAMRSTTSLPSPPFKSKRCHQTPTCRRRPTSNPWTGGSRPSTDAYRGE